MYVPYLKTAVVTYRGDIDGMDLNPLFINHTSFKPGGSGGELDLFEKAGIKLVHGWLVDPDGPEAPVVSKYQDYDTSVNLIAEADHVSGGKLLVGEEFVATGTSSSKARVRFAEEGEAGPSTGPTSINEGQRSQIEDGELPPCPALLDRQLNVHLSRRHAKIPG
jgi:hypothetical protein